VKRGKNMKCADCTTNKCHTGKNCTPITTEEAVEMYNDDEKKMMAAAACTGGQNYTSGCRLQESVFFAQKLGAKKIGLAFCIGLVKESAQIAAYFEKYFEVHSVCCKVCGISKESLALEKVSSDQFEAMCNPKVQAKKLADAETEFNFTIGLCVGHDALFNKASSAPVSCLITKDRVLGHNPIAAIYSGYWQNKLGIS
jgi:uncharacterized metal-binding protein